MTMELNIGGFVRRAAERHGDKPALIFEGQKISFRQLNSRVNRLAQALLSLGARKGDKVGLLLANSLEFAETFLAVAKMGGIAVPLNVRLVGRELTYILNNADVRFLFLGQEFIDVIGGIQENLNQVERYIVAGDSSHPSMERYETLLARALDKEPEIVVREEDPAAILYTSGTTGRPKGAVITHRNIIWNEINYIIDKDLRVNDIALLVSPLFHAGGLNNLLTHIFLGSTVVLHRTFSPQAVPEAIEKEKITVIQTMAPTMYNMILQLPDLGRYDFSSVRSVMSGGAILPVETKKKIQQLFPHAGIQDSYGLTEVTSTGTALKPEFALQKIASIGKPFFTLEVRLIDERGEEVAPGQVGEIVLRGPNVMKEYYKDPEATESTLRDGWLHTGDLAKKDEEGFLYIVDRKKDMIISGAENIYPKEIEEVLYTHPKILEAAVIGVPDPVWGEAVKAVVVLKPGEEMTQEEVIAFCKANLASYKKPRSVDFVSSLPKTAFGKIAKVLLRESYRGLENY
jgi:acyl-CoA synthetase (AMP-forming)/AMP-acid ligase II